MSGPRHALTLRSKGQGHRLRSVHVKTTAQISSLSRDDLYLMRLRHYLPSYTVSVYRRIFVHCELKLWKTRQKISVHYIRIFLQCTVGV